MKLLILGSVALPVPPPMQGGTERIAYFQATGLSKRGHDVTLIAAAGSKHDSLYTLVEIGGGDTVSGQLQQPSQGHALKMAVGLAESSRNLRKELVYMAHVSEWVLTHGKEFDVILNNMRGGESVLLPIAKLLGVPFVTVMHLPIFDELADLFRQYQTQVITISNAQRKGFDGLQYAGTVYNCVEPALLSVPSTLNPDPYVLILGSIAPHKNQKDGILAAKKLGKKIILAGKIGNQAYWDTEIAPFVDGKTVIHKGELRLEEKTALLAGAEALLFPIIWPEPFGLVMIEAMACGTPVVAYDNGAVPEVVRDGVTGFIIEPGALGQDAVVLASSRSRSDTFPSSPSSQGHDDAAKQHPSPRRITQTGVTGLAEAINRINEIDRAACRRHVEANFSMSVMLDSLEDALGKVVHP